MSSITQAELKLNSLKLHNAYPIKKWLRFPNEYEALICMGEKSKGLGKPRFCIFNIFFFMQGPKEPLIYILKDQIEAIAFVPSY